MSLATVETIVDQEIILNKKDIFPLLLQACGFSFALSIVSIFLTITIYVLDFILKDKATIVIFIFAMIIALMIGHLIGIVLNQLEKMYGPFIAVFICSFLGNIGELFNVIILCGSGDKNKIKIAIKTSLGSIASTSVLLVGLIGLFNYLTNLWYGTETKRLDAVRQHDNTFITFVLLNVMAGCSIFLNSNPNISQRLIDVIQRTYAITSFIYYIFYLFSQFFELQTGREREESSIEESKNPLVLYWYKNVSKRNKTIILVIYLSGLIAINYFSADLFITSLERILVEFPYPTIMSTIGIPIGNDFCEHICAITILFGICKRKINVAMETASQSSINVIGFVFPLITLISWIEGVNINIFHDVWIIGFLWLGSIGTQFTTGDAYVTPVEGIGALCSYASFIMISYILDSM